MRISGNSYFFSNLRPLREHLTENLRRQEHISAARTLNLVKIFVRFADIEVRIFDVKDTFPLRGHLTERTFNREKYTARNPFHEHLNHGFRTEYSENAGIIFRKSRFSDI